MLSAWLEKFSDSLLRVLITLDMRLLETMERVICELSKMLAMIRVVWCGFLGVCGG